MTISPFEAVDCLRTMTESPSKIPALIILSPLIRSMNKSSASFCSSGGIGKKSLASSTARIGSPAVTTPSIGIAVDLAPIALSPAIVNSMARGLLGSR